MKTFLALVFCLLAIDQGDATLLGSEIDLGLGVSLDLLPTIGNWIVIMHRFDGTLSFNRVWDEYRDGFGKMGEGEFWLGNEIVHRLTTIIGDVYTLRIEMYADGAWYYADYATFALDSEIKRYAIRVSGFSGGNASDSLTNTTAVSHWYHGGMKFSTKDFDNDGSSSMNCAEQNRAGWWFNACWMSCLTCEYGTGFIWGGLKHLPSNGRLLAARMMIKRKCA